MGESKLNRINRLLRDRSQQLILAAALLALLLAYIYFAISIGPEHKVPAILCVALGIYGIGLLVGLYVALKKDIAFERMFFVALVATGLMYMGIFAPFKAPDEQTHYASAYRWSNVIMGKDGLGETFEMRAEDKKVMGFWWRDHRSLDKDYTQVKNRLHFFCADATPVVYEPSSYFSFNPKTRLPQMYLPGTLGLTLGRLLGLSAMMAMYLGRLFQLLTVALLVYFAMKKLPTGKLVLATVMFFPITLELITSYSYDAPIIAMAMLLGATCLEAMQKTTPITGKEIVLIVALVFLLTPCKVVYAIVSVMALFVPKRRFKERRNYWLFIGGVCLAALVPILLFTFGRVGGMATAASSIEVHNSSGAPDNPNHVASINFGMVLADPLWALNMFVGTLVHQSAEVYEGFFGGLMAWGRDLEGPAYIPAFFASMFVLSFFTSSSIEEQTRSKRGIAVLLFCIALLAIYASMLVGWTAVNAPYIKGVQGRYFIPLVPLLLLAFTGLPVRFNKDISKPFLMGLAFMNVYYAGWIFSTIAGLPVA